MMSSAGSSPSGQHSDALLSLITLLADPKASVARLTEIREAEAKHVDVRQAAEAAEASAAQRLRDLQQAEEKLTAHDAALAAREAACVAKETDLIKLLQQQQQATLALQQQRTEHLAEITAREEALGQAKYTMAAKLEEERTALVQQMTDLAAREKIAAAAETRAKALMAEAKQKLEALRRAVA